MYPTKPLPPLPKIKETETPQEPNAGETPGPKSISKADYLLHEFITCDNVAVNNDNRSQRPAKRRLREL